jgi:alpha-galactosidase
VVVEVPAIVSGKGIQPLHVGQLPMRLMLGVMIPRLLITERSLAAFLTGDRRYLYDILLSDHRTRSLEQAEVILQSVLDLPGNEEMVKHFFASQASLTAF